jgi:multiple sugar transport system permease protein
MVRTIRGWKRFFLYLISAAIAVWLLFPFYWAITNAFKPRREQFEPGSMIPWLHYEPTLDIWREVFTTSSPIPPLINSIIVTAGTTIMVIVLGTMAAYSISRFRFGRSGNGNRDLAVFFLSQRVLPPVVVLIPFFILLNTFRLTDTHVGLMMVYITFNMPFGVLIMRQIFNEIPRQLEEAAAIDGASEYYTFFRVSLPLAVNGLVATGVIVFAFAWNEPLFALTLTGQNAQTLPVFILSSRSTRGVRFGFAAVNTLLAIGPPVIFSLFIQRYLAKGLTFGAVKG